MTTISMPEDKIRTGPWVLVYHIGKDEVETVLYLQTPLDGMVSAAWKGVYDINDATVFNEHSEALNWLGLAHDFSGLGNWSIVELATLR